MENVKTQQGQFVAYFKDSVQISADDWKIISRKKLFDKHTTVTEIKEWADSFGKQHVEHGITIQLIF